MAFFVSGVPGDLSGNSSPSPSPLTMFWSARRFEILYRDVVVPFLRRFSYQRHQQRSVRIPNSSPTVVIPNFDAGGQNRSTPERKVSNNSFNEGTSTPDNFEAAPSQLSDDDFAFNHNDFYKKDPEIKHLWGLLSAQLELFVHPLGLAGDKSPLESPTTVHRYAGNYDVLFDKTQLDNFIVSHAPELIKVGVFFASKNDFASFVEGSRLNNAAGEILHPFDSTQEIQKRQTIIYLLVDMLSSRLNLHQVECLQLLSTHLQVLHSSTPPALTVETCVMPRDQTSTNSSDVLLSPFGHKLLRSCSNAFRREQLFHLWCLQELATDMYPLEQPGVETVVSVNVPATFFMYQLVKRGFLENLIATIKFLIFESTKQKPQLIKVTERCNESPTDISNDVSGWETRSWTRRLAQIASRLLLVLTARFQHSSSSLFGLAQLLSGAVFDETCIIKLKNELKCGRRSVDDSLDYDTAGDLVTSLDFDLATKEDLKKYSEDSEAFNPEDFILFCMKPSVDVLDMTSVLTITFLNAIDPQIGKWPIFAESKGVVDQQRVALELIEFPPPCASEWLKPRPHEDLSACNFVEMEFSWLEVKSKNHDVDAFWIESTVFGRLASFAATVAYTRPLDIRRLRLALSSTWNLFDVIRSKFLDRFGGVSPLSKIGCHTVASLLRQTFLPLSSQWAQVVRIDKLAIQARKKSQLKQKSESLEIFRLLGPPSYTSYLTPIMKTLNRLCSMSPDNIDDFQSILFAVVESFAWNDVSVSTNVVSTPQQGESPYSDASAWRLKSQLYPNARHFQEANDDVSTASLIDDDVPSVSGVGFPAAVHYSSALPNDNNDRFKLTRDVAAHKNCERFVYGTSQKDCALNDDDLSFLFPLFAEVLNFAATIVAIGRRTVSVQVATKLTTQPSLVGFFMPHALVRLLHLFKSLTSGKLQTELKTAFDEQKRNRAIHLRRGELALAVNPGNPSSLIDEDEECEDRLFEGLLETKISDILKTCSSVFRFLVASFSPRLYVTDPPPPPLIAQSTSPPISVDDILDYSYCILSSRASASDLGIGESGFAINGLYLIALKCVVVEGLLGGFESGAFGGVRVFSAFVRDILPVVLDDLRFVKSLASIGLNSSSFSGGNFESQECSPNSQAMKVLASAQELTGSLATNTVTYMASFLARVGFRLRFSSITPELIGSSTSCPPADFFNRTGLYSNYDPHALANANFFVIREILPLLHSSCQRTILSSMHFWRLTAVTFKFILFVLRGPLPFLQNEQVDFISREPFVSVKENLYGGQLGCSPTEWLIRSFLSLDSFALNAVLLLIRTAWQELLLPWTPSENSAGLFQIQTVETELRPSRVSVLSESKIRFLLSPEACQGVSTAASWEFVSGLEPLHHHLMRDGSRIKPEFMSRSATSLGSLYNRLQLAEEKGSSDSVPHAVFLLELALSENHRCIKKKGLFLLHQLNCREPAKMATLLTECPGHVDQLQFSMASAMRSLDLEDFERWEYLDSLGLHDDGDFPMSDSPDVFLRPLFPRGQYASDSVTGATSSILAADAPQESILDVWETSDCLEVSTFKSETSSVDYPAFFHSECEAPLLQGFVVDKNANTALRAQAPEIALPYSALGLITSKYTSLPIHRKLEKRINAAEDAVCFASDSAAWSATLKHFNVPWRLQCCVATSLLRDVVFPPLTSLAPFLVPRVMEKSDELYSNALWYLSQGGRDGHISALGQPHPFDEMSTRTLCFTVLHQWLAFELKREVEVPTTSLLLLGFSSATLTNELDAPIMSLNVPLPDVSCPFVTPSSADEELDLNTDCWLKNAMLILDSIFLAIEDPNAWLSDSFLRGDNTMTTLSSSDEERIQLILSDPSTYSELSYQEYCRLKIALVSVETLVLLVTHKQTADASLYLLSVRLPHRHDIFRQLALCGWNFGPPVLQSLKKLIFSSWTELIAAECHLCATLTYVELKLPKWLKQFNPILDSFRLKSMQNQVLDAVLALLQSPISDTVSYCMCNSQPIAGLCKSLIVLQSPELSSMGVRCPKGTPVFFASFLYHLLVMERQFTASNDCHQQIELDSTLADHFLFSHSDIWLFNRRLTNKLQFMTAPIIEPHQVLLISMVAQAFHGEVEGPLHSSFTFNLKSMSVLAAQRIAVSLSYLLASLLDFITTEVKKSLPVSSVIESIEKSLAICVDPLELNVFKTKRVQYALTSATSLLVNCLADVVSLPAKSTNLVADDYTTISTHTALLSRASIKSMFMRLGKMCIESGMKVPVSPQSCREGKPGIVDRCCRLALYASANRLLRLSSNEAWPGAPKLANALLEGVYQADSLFVRHLLSNILEDLLEEASVSPQTSTLCASNAKNLAKYKLSSQDNTIGHVLYPNLFMIPSIAAISLLKSIVDASSIFLRQNVSFDTQKRQNFSKASQLHLPFLASVKWIPSDILNFLGGWIARVYPTCAMIEMPFSSVEACSIRAGVSSAQHPTECAHLSYQENFKNEVMDVNQAFLPKAVYALLGQLSQHPSLAEAILSPKTAFPTSFPRSHSDESPCRAFIFSSPFLGNHNSAIPITEFGFPAERLTGSEVEDDLSNFVRWLKGAKEQTTSVKVQIFPFLLGAISKLLNQLELIDVKLVNQDHYSPNFIILLWQTFEKRAQGHQKSSLPAPLVLLKWWLNRDRILSSNFTCLLSLMNKCEGVSLAQLDAKAHINCQPFLETFRIPGPYPNGNHAFTVSRSKSLTDSWRKESFCEDDFDASSSVDNSNDVAEASQMRENLFARYLRQKLIGLFCSLMITGRVWCQLLSLVTGNLDLTPPRNLQPVNAIVESFSTVGASLSFDESLLIFAFQDTIVQCVTKVLRLAVVRVLAKDSQDGDRKRVHWSETIRTMLQPQYLTIELAESFTPDSATLLTLCTDVLKAIGKEFDLYKWQLQRPGRADGEQQILEQVKRFFLERSRALVAIANSGLLAFLHSVPIESELHDLRDDIANFVGMERRTILQDDVTCAQTTSYLSESPFMVLGHLRVLGVGLPLLLKGLVLVLQFEGVATDMPSTTGGNSFDNRKTDYLNHVSPFILQLLAAIHPSLVNQVFVQALTLCIRVCGCMTELSSSDALLHKLLESQRPMQNRKITFECLMKAYRVVCVESIRLKDFVSTLIWPS